MATDTSPPVARLGSLDAYRGFVMLLMMAEVLRLGDASRALPGNRLLAFLAWHQSHVPWGGCTLHDLIQPSFSFLVGAAVPFSLAARRGRGQTDRQLLLHAAWRALVLVLLGIFLRSVGQPATNYTFEDTLTQIGLGYPFLVLVALRPPRATGVTLLAILVGTWAAWTFLHAGGDDWAKNANLGHDFDVWFLNRFPRPEPFVANPGGYLTLSFVPTLATSLMGLVAGRWLIAKASVGRFLVVGSACLVGGVLLDVTGLCPIVKRIWTPAWVLFSGGACFWMLAAFHEAVDVRGWQRLAWPLEVVGMNSITAYVIAHLWEGFIQRSLLTHAGAGVFAVGGPALAPVFLGAATLLVMWLVLWWMARRRIILRI